VKRVVFIISSKVSLLPFCLCKKRDAGGECESGFIVNKGALFVPFFFLFVLSGDVCVKEIKKIRAR
jgi:hypothetical protein